MTRRLARPFAVVGLTLAVVSAVLAVAVRVVDPVPVIENTFGFGDVALVGFGFLGVAFAAVGALLVVRRPDNAVGWLMVFVGAGYAASGLAASITFSAVAHESTASLNARVAGWFAVLLSTCAGVVFGLPVIFPTGRGHTEAWDRVLRIGLVAGPLTVLVFVTQPGPLHLWPDLENPFGFGPDFRPLLGRQLSQVGSLVAVFVLPFVVWAIGSRYRLAEAVVRQQMKWFILSMVVAMAAISIAAAGPNFVDDPPEIGLAVFGFVGALVPIAIGIAILRHGLYDIDRLISRTLAYGIVTGVLVAVFVTSVVGLSALLGSLAEGNSLAVALSTLLVAVLFGPLRRRAQTAMDRRFDRARYDSERTAAAFSERLRDEVDLATVTGDLTRTARAALAPTTLGIWIRGGDAGQ